jgi:hypothetical protein
VFGFHIFLLQGCEGLRVEKQVKGKSTGWARKTAVTEDKPTLGESALCWRFASPANSEGLPLINS